MHKEAKYLLDHGLAIPSESPWTSPSLLIPKPDQTVHFCTDYCKVNAITKPDSLPLPRMDDCVDCVELLNRYWQLSLTPRASEISAFAIPDQSMHCTVMPFGIRKASATFQLLMRKVLGEVAHCEVCLNDIVVYMSTWPEYVHSEKSLTG